MKRDFSALALVSAPLAAMMFVILMSTNLGPPLSPADFYGVAGCVVVALLAELFAMDFRIGAGEHQPQTSLAFLPFLASIIIFSPVTAALILTGVVSIAQFGLRRNRPARAIYNICVAAISAGLAGVLYHSITPSGHHVISLQGFVGFVAAAGVFFSTNILFASVGISYLRRQPFIHTIQQVAGPKGAHLAYDLLASPLALIVILLYNSFDRYPVLGILIIVLPLILINYSYTSTWKIMKANQDLLRALVTVIETRDPYTSGHSVRVATLAKAIATDLGLSFWRIHKVETAALLHDIGKIDPIYAAVLRKPFDLSSEERALIQTHAARGAAMLQNLGSMDAGVVQAVLHHHERYDGLGYPAQISAMAIPLTARIIMLCDSVDAMLSDRPYRKALTVEAVRSELVRCSGTQFDPEIVRVMLERGTLEKAVELVDAGTVDEVGTSLMAV